MERVICAAIWYDDKKQRGNQPLNIKTGIVACGLRHANCFPILFAVFPNGEYKKSCIQGFLTNRNRFVNREEAAMIAMKAKQIDKPKYFGGLELDSSDLY